MLATIKKSEEKTSLWYPQKESNLHLRIRNPPFYPLNYRGATWRL